VAALFSTLQGSTPTAAETSQCKDGCISIERACPCSQPSDTSPGGAAVDPKTSGSRGLSVNSHSCASDAANVLLAHAVATWEAIAVKSWSPHSQNRRWCCQSLSPSSRSIAGDRNQRHGHTNQQSIPYMRMRHDQLTPAAAAARTAICARKRKPQGSVLMHARSSILSCACS
jgi:hypothetical protein